MLTCNTNSYINCIENVYVSKIEKLVAGLYAIGLLLQAAARLDVVSACRSFVQKVPILEPLTIGQLRRLWFLQNNCLLLGVNDHCCWTMLSYN